MDESSDTCDCVDCQTEIGVALGRLTFDDLTFDAGSDPLCFAHGEPRCPLCVKESY